MAMSDDERKDGDDLEDGAFAYNEKKSKKKSTHIGRVKMLREAIVAAVTPAEMVILFKEMMSEAQEGNIAARKLLLEYTVGKPQDPELAETVKNLEEQLERLIRGF